MPIYEYECRRCSARFEVKRGFAENSSVPCPKCQGETYLVFSPVPVIFKGPGFYATDNMVGGKGNPFSESDKDKSEVEDKGEG